jgi:short-subunit dehydrogenase
MIISGTYGLAVYLSQYFTDAKYYSVFKLLEEPVKDNILINCEHKDFKQVELFDYYFQEWKREPTKYIINISSRAAQPNISKGYLYASQKAALNHYSNNIVYNSNKACKITTLNLGLMKHKTLPSISYEDVAETISWLIQHPHEIPEITLQHKANYRAIQYEKAQSLQHKKNIKR